MIYVDKNKNVTNCLICENRMLSLCECTELAICIEDCSLKKIDKMNMLDELKNNPKTLEKKLLEYKEKKKNIWLEIKKNFPNCYYYNIYPYFKQLLPFYYDK